MSDTVLACTRKGLFVFECDAARWRLAHHAFPGDHVAQVLVDPRDGNVLWSGSARRPVPVRSALTVPELLIDAGPAIFAEAFGEP